MMPDLDFGELNLAWARWQMRVGGKTRQRLWRRLARLIDNGVPILTALTNLRDRRLRLKSTSDPLAMALAAWAEGVQNGQRLADAMTGWLPEQERMLIAAGEHAGSIAKSLGLADQSINARMEIRGAVIGGALYPLALVAASIALLWMFGTSLVPNIAASVPEDKWTGQAAQMIQVSHWIRDWLWLVVVALLGLGAAFFVSLPRWHQGALRARFDRHAPYSVYRLMAGASWVQSFAALIGSGVRAEDALRTLAERADPWLRSRIEACMQGMREGYNLGDALARAGHGFPDPDVIDDLSVYSAMAGFEEALNVIGRDLLTDTVASIRLAMKGVFNVGITIMGLVLIWMVTGMQSMQQQLAMLMRAM